MTKPLYLLLAVLGLIWTMFCWFLATILGAGGKTVTAITRWLGADVSSTQWLADTLSVIGGTVQIVVWIAWAVGAGALVAVGLLGSRMIAEGRRTTERLARAQRGYSDPDLRGDGPTFEGEVRRRDISDPESDRRP